MSEMREVWQGEGGAKAMMGEKVDEAAFVASFESTLKAVINAAPETGVVSGITITVLRVNPVTNQGNISSAIQMNGLLPGAMEPFVLDSHGSLMEVVRQQKVAMRLSRATEGQRGN